MRTTTSLYLAFLIFLTPFAAAQPVIRASNGIVNASSQLSDIARGSWFVIYGAGLGPSSISVQSGAPYPTQLSGTSVTFTPILGGSPVNALMYYTLATQVAAMLPSSTPTGSYNVKLTYSNQTGAAVTVNVVERNFGFATQTSNGQGPAQATYGGYDLNRFTTGALGQWSTRPAYHGDSMILWGTGLGADPASDANGGTSGDQTAAAQVKVILGGIPIAPEYAGRSGGSPGLDQINFTIPVTVTPSCFVSLQVSAGGKLSNLGSIAVAPTGLTSCMSPVFTQAQLRTFDQGGTLTAGGLQLNKVNAIYTPALGVQTETVAGWFGKYAVDEAAQSNLAIIQPGVCSQLQRTAAIEGLIFGPPARQTLDAGVQLLLNGPNATNKPVPRQADGTYQATLYSNLVGSATGSPTLSLGTYSLAGTGGANIGAFSASVTLPSSFIWSNETTVVSVIPRSSPLTLSWTGGENSVVVVFAAAVTRLSGPILNASYSAKGFVCAEQGSAGTFTVPSNILQQLPAVSGDPSGATFGVLSLFAVSDVSRATGSFSAPLPGGGTLDLGVLGYELALLKTTGYN